MFTHLQYGELIFDQKRDGFYYFFCLSNCASLEQTERRVSYAYNLRDYKLEMSLMHE
jgi:hypothetical protein